MSKTPTGLEHTGWTDPKPSASEGEHKKDPNGFQVWDKDCAACQIADNPHTKFVPKPSPRPVERESWEERFDEMMSEYFITKESGIDEIKSFIRQVREEAKAEQRKVERERAALIVEEMMEDSEHWRPIAARIIES